MSAIVIGHIKATCGTRLRHQRQHTDDLKKKKIQMCNTLRAPCSHKKLNRFNFLLHYPHFYFPIPFLKNFMHECSVSLSMHATCVLVPSEARRASNPRDLKFRVSDMQVLGIEPLTFQTGSQSSLVSSLQPIPLLPNSLWTKKLSDSGTHVSVSLNLRFPPKATLLPQGRLHPDPTDLYLQAHPRAFLRTAQLHPISSHYPVSSCFHWGPSKEAGRLCL